MNVIRPAESDAADGVIAASDPGQFVRHDDHGHATLDLMVDGVHCAGCIAKIERGLKAVPGVAEARLNLTTRRLHVAWRPDAANGADIVGTVEGLGYHAQPFDPAQLVTGAAAEGKRLMIAMAVAGFAAGNVMLLSISVWAGMDMGPMTRDLFHWISALIALPAIAYAGRPFFASAIAALKSGAMNMDVPISLAVILAAGMSVVQTAHGAEHAYFDASVTLLFFLLIGRYLDHRARAKARSAAEHLLSLAANSATVIDFGGGRRTAPIGDIEPGMMVAVAAGERIPLDGVIAEGASDVDTSLVNGESVPASVASGARVFAGTLNLTGPLSVRVSAAAEDSLLAEIVRLMETAEQGRARYVRLADRVARFYAPAVHILAAATFAGWWGLAGDWQLALINAITVLIITCPCALGLAVPVVQVVANGALFRRGILVTKPNALERLAQIDTVVFDKTGTLTSGRPALAARDGIDPAVLRLAVALARHSKHPLSRALTGEQVAGEVPSVTDVAEHPGFGIEANVEGRRVRLGSRVWCGVSADTGADDGRSELWLVEDGRAPVRFAFEDRLRSDAADTIAALRAKGYRLALLSGDRVPAVRDVAQALGIADWRAECHPADKVAAIEALAAEGKVLMVGDGLNDAPALAAGHASLSPAEAADISQIAADAVFQGERLGAVTDLLAGARTVDRLVKQNLALAFLYNAIAIPVAVLGFATPLIAAVAMSSSSLLVTANAFRLRFARRGV